MNTNDIIESLKVESIWRSNQPLPSALLNAIEGGLQERDKLRAVLATIQEKATQAPGGYLIDGALMGLIDIALAED